MQSPRASDWFQSGAPWIWLSAAAVSISLFAVLSLILLLAVRGFGHFWPDTVVQIRQDNQTVLGEIKQTEAIAASRLKGLGVALPDGEKIIHRHLIKTGNRELTGLDFRWFYHVTEIRPPEDVYVLERREWGNFYGYLKAVNGRPGPDLGATLQQQIEAARAIQHEITQIEKIEIGAVNFQLDKLRLKARRLELNNALNAANRASLQAERNGLDRRYQSLRERLTQLHDKIAAGTVSMQTSDNRVVDIPLSKIVRAYQPNKLTVFEKLSFYFEKLWEFVSDEPREANTEGGIFPAIFGTVLLVLIMSMLVTPMGVIAAVYLREYANQGFLTRLIRIAVNNLAGVPAIVYGIFGLGFFVYFLGGAVDQVFYPESLPAPVFGTPGLLWASITLAVLTLPVVIVATEEGLARIPRSIREGSLALGATKAETLWRTVIPMASPAIMTGMILAISRAAGEVAPLMLVGVVKLAPSLPLDGNFPFLHLERKFMHLGFHIFDVGFQSPNVEAARPLVYATALLLVVVIIVLNLSAIAIRNHLREKYRALEN
ncbi:MAG: phosphate ABC transporter permease PstA [Methylococcaceae bacterium]|nr:phosphate ABC transporter permease PstA [Methylococcaceae bacterium]MCI0732360.1 phosphate ABC transporter permease PstA [Methylococcaceae bacterium]